MTVDDDDTMMPMKEVVAKLTGIEMNCDHSASLGFRANREMSGSLTISVAKLAMEDMISDIMAQPSAPPDFVLP